MTAALSGIVISMLTAAASPGALPGPRLQVEVRADQHDVDTGRSVSLDISVRTESSIPAADCLLLPYVNGRRWGAHEVTDGQGRARVILPLPNPGLARVVVRAVPGFHHTCWIWTERGAAKNAYLMRSFAMTFPVDSARIHAAATGHSTVYLNGSTVGKVAGITEEARIEVPNGLLKVGQNIIAIEADNSSGMAGVAAQLRFHEGGAERIISTDSEWRAWEQAPAGWPGSVTDAVTPARALARLWDDLLPSKSFESWFGGVHRDELFVGRLLPDNACASAPLDVDVRRRAITGRRDPAHLVGIQWGSYYFPGGFYWQTAQAVPVVGFYDTYNRDVIRQHALWFMDMGIDFLVADWPVYIPPNAEGKQRWADRTEFGIQQIHATTMMLEGLAELRDEGYPAPAMVIMAYLSNGPANTKETLNEQLTWLNENFIRNPRFHDLWVVYEGKPLVCVLYTGGTPASQLPGPPVDTSSFTIRYVGTQLQATHVDELGHWSWMDGVAEPIVTYANGRPEVVTPATAFFSLKTGWRGEDAYGRRNGATFLRSFNPALKARPQFVLFHQWNEFTGQAEGYPYESGIYGDSYSVELSDDIEPVSLTSPGYRGDHGGWGFLYANLTRAMVDLLKQETPQDSLLAVYSPRPGEQVTGDSVTVGWELLGKAPESFTLLIDQVQVAHNVKGSAYSLSLSSVSKGRHVLSVLAEGVTTHFPLLEDRMDTRLDEAIPVRRDITFVRE
ncbi:MAG: hypothetical protein HZB26_25245 [Candidatus Hydrogenedentes bacterium]|nr:hypothetical protein [Candidatus Hydrogenedentota bacterium]